MRGAISRCAARIAFRSGSLSFEGVVKLCTLLHYGTASFADWHTARRISSAYLGKFH